MTLKITKNILIIFLFVSSISHAQIIIQSGKLPLAGDYWPNKTITDTTIHPGPSGANQTWNFTNFFVIPTVVSETFSSPTGTANDALFPSANLKVNSFFGGDDYYLKTSSDLQYLGTKSSTNEIIISNMQKVLTTPLAFGDSIVNPNVTGTGFGYALSGTISVKADGWGSLGLYTGNFANTLRVVTDINLVLGAGTGIDTYVQIKRYTWYVQNYKAPVFQISTIYIDGPLGSANQKVITVSLLTTSIEETAKNYFQFNVNSNPAVSKADLSVRLLKSADVIFRVTDLIGKTWKVEQNRFSAGLNNFSIDISELPRGIYIISAYAGTLNRQQRIVVD